MENAGQCLRGRADAGQQRVGGSLFGNGSEFSQEKLLALEHPVFVISALASSSYFFFLSWGPPVGFKKHLERSFLGAHCPTELVMLNTTGGEVSSGQVGDSPRYQRSLSSVPRGCLLSPTCACSPCSCAVEEEPALAAIWSKLG